MTEFFNPYTKTRFSVADDRIEEYKAAGFPLAADSEKPKSEVKEAKTEDTETVKAPKKATKKAKK